MRLIILISLALAACDAPISRSDAEAIAEDMADDVASEHTRQLESRISDLEQRLDKQYEYTKAVSAALDEERENRRRAVQNLMDHYNEHLYQSHGVARTSGSN